MNVMKTGALLAQPIGAVDIKTVILILFGAVSILIGAAFFIRALMLYKKGSKAKRVLSPVQLYTVGVFISVVLVFIPIYYTDYDFGDAHYYIRPLLLALHNALRVFILDGDFKIIVDALSGQGLVLRVCYSLYVAFLYVIAPVLTFGNVLSLFKNIKGEARYHWHRYKKHYIMSELNAKSVALAKSIHKKDAAAVIVFTDVFEQNEEDDYELLTEVRDINAICLRKDIAHLNILSKKGDVELFLIGENESENVSQAVKITVELNKTNTKHNVKVFVFSQSPSGAYIMDSLKYDNLLRNAGRHGYDESCFKLRRINEKQQLIWNTVPKMKLFDIAERHHRVLSVLIVGFGSYGMELFKMLVWYCQFEGYKLQINIVDQQKSEGEGKNRVRAMIDRMCPELMKKNRSELDEDAPYEYDIKIFSDIDMRTSDFDELLLYRGEDEMRSCASERLKNTNVALVALGDDDLNIEVAVHLRSLFDKVNGVVAKKDIKWEDEAVDIYSVVYDEQKSGILHHEDADCEMHLLTNHKEIPYHIHFIGGMSAQFHYDNIYNGELEKGAYAHHIGWIAIEEQIKKELAMPKKETYEINLDELRECYEKYEYYRLSSIAKELYQREIRSNPVLAEQSVCREKDKLRTCQCENCVRRKRSEHMRWNAYTRVIGYEYRENVRADRAKWHNDLREWSELPVLEREKD